jgi:hypothetical protein
MTGSPPRSSHEPPRSDALLSSSRNAAPFVRIPNWETADQTGGGCCFGAASSSPPGFVSCSIASCGVSEASRFAPVSRRSKAGRFAYNLRLPRSPTRHTPIRRHSPLVVAAPPRYTIWYQGPNQSAASELSFPRNSRPWKSPKQRVALSGHATGSGIPASQSMPLIIS